MKPDEAMIVDDSDIGHQVAPVPMSDFEEDDQLEPWRALAKQNALTAYADEDVTA
jgi:hypothetical protein